MPNSPTFGDERLLHPAKHWMALYRHKYMRLHTQVCSLNVICHFNTIIFQLVLQNSIGTIDTVSIHFGIVEYRYLI